MTKEIPISGNFIQSDIRCVDPGKKGLDGTKFPPKWRIAISARPTFWDCRTSGRCHSYRRLTSFGEAKILYFLGDYPRACEVLRALAEQLNERRESRDRVDMPLFFGVDNDE